MDLPAHYFNPYDRLAPFYDFMASAMLLPFGGERAFRRRALAPLALTPGMRVLELGCGTGANTRELLRQGAEVTAVDLSAPMLARAQRKAPAAHFTRGDILAFRAEQPFDRVWLAFVLHEMDAATRAQALATARAALAPDGRLGVLDFCGGAPGWVDLPFRAYLRVAEPEMAREILARGLEPELEASGLQVLERRDLALGTARTLVTRAA